MPKFKEKEKNYIVEKAGESYKDVPGFQITITDWRIDSVLATCKTLNNFDNSDQLYGT